MRGGRSLFYKLFNANTQSAYQLRTDAFRLVTRRAINRVHASSAHLPYRKAAYAASGLKMADLEFDGQLTVKGSGRFNLAVDSLALYTDFGFKASMTITLCMLALALAELVYTLIIFATGHPGCRLDHNDVCHHRGLCRAVCRADHRGQVPLPAAEPQLPPAEVSGREH